MITLSKLSCLRPKILAILLVLLVSACDQVAVPSPLPPTATTGLPDAPVPTASPLPTPTTVTTVEVLPAETSLAAASPSPELPTPTSATAAFEGVPCEAETCQSSGSFFLKRPIGLDGRNSIVGSSRFGEYSRNLKGGYHGAFFLNSTGTPVLAAADGTVVLAGDDSGTPVGPYKNLYGNLVILRHDLPGLSEPVFTLYGHLSEILVQADENVTAGQEIGKVGMSGDVSGSTLVLEVRMGTNEYTSVRNPGLWLEPLPGENGELLGALAGRILDANGKLLSVPNIILEQLAGPGLPAVQTLYQKTYSESRISGQSPWGENFAAWDLPAGEYQISFWLKGLHQRVVEIQPGKLTQVTFQIP